ncbi:MAG: IS4 family transposase, partial [Desulfobacterales bacterium]|nr:IS4 family transposase [Desulfobacterales bacterium]MDX2512226.1 IS4 family transposase [Desulfobacterales bacterium]
NWLYKLHRNRCFFVTRIKTNTRYRVTERRNVLKNKGLTSDQTIILTGTKAHRCPIRLRRIGYRDPESKKQYFFLTNNLKLAAKTIADIYHQRWQVEIFFKWVKQHLKIKTFFGTTRNAVLSQIWTALIALLILALYKYRARLGLSLSEILQLLQLNLFEKRNLWALFEVDVPLKLNTDQLLFEFMYL